jgi:geranylgeranyl pyrophosphate synthase
MVKREQIENKQQYYAESGVESAFTEYFSKTKKQIESELSKFISSLPQVDLRSKIEYAVLSDGKRFRPFLVILAAECVGGKGSKVMPLALAFELMHTSTLVHDDIIDQDEMRRGHPSLYKKTSVNEAILAGDALIALSVSLASPFGENILKNVAQSALELCEGERMDLVDCLRTTTEEVYFQKIRNKSASLCRAATCCGAIAGGGSPTEQLALSKFGESLGIAYQLRDDLLDFMVNRDFNLKDLSNGRVTLPLIYCYANSTPKEKKEIEKLQTLISKDSSSASEKAKEILRIVRQKGAFEYCENKTDEYLTQAVTSLSVLKDTDYKAYLIQIAKTLRSWETA